MDVCVRMKLQRQKEATSVTVNTAVVMRYVMFNLRLAIA